MNTRENEINSGGKQLFLSLNNRDVIEAKISDHYPVIQDEVLFWNVMMQCKARSNGFNNGFGLIESDSDYERRLEKIAAVIAEMIQYNSLIKTINLCESPIGNMEKLFYERLMRYPHMKKRFMRPEQDGFYKPYKQGTDWGLITLVDKHFHVKSVFNLETMLEEEHQKDMNNRLDVLELSHGSQQKWVALAHLPFGVIKKEVKNQFATDSSHLTLLGNACYQLISKLLIRYQNSDFTITADFNFVPDMLSSNRNNIFGFSIPFNNSVVLIDNKPQSVTVDGILTSQLNRQKKASQLSIYGLFGKLKQEHELWLTVDKRRDTLQLLSKL
jgi:hypothetical protein